MTRDLLNDHRLPEQQERRIDQARAVMGKIGATWRRSGSTGRLRRLWGFVRNKGLACSGYTATHYRPGPAASHPQVSRENAPGYVMRMDPSGVTGTIRLGADATARLIRFRESRQLPRSKLESGGDSDVVIRNHVNRGEHPAKYG